MVRIKQKITIEELARLLEFKSVVDVASDLDISCKALIAIMTANKLKDKVREKRRKNEEWLLEKKKGLYR